MKKVKVSVLMPVYNTARYLSEAIESILNQSFRDFELIIIDDGSVDTSLEIMQRYANQDSRIVYRTRENKGVSITRNECLELAVGDFIYFMDSDDVLDKDTLERCYSRCLEDNLDMVFFDADEMVEAGCTSRPILYDRSGKMEEQPMSGVEALRKLVDRYAYSPSLCLIFFSRHLVTDNGVRFVERIVHEDQVFTTQLYALAQNVRYISHKFFHRRVRAHSIMSVRYSMRNIRSYFVVGEHLRAFAAAQEPSTQRVLSQHLSQMMDAAVYQCNTFGFRDRMEVFQAVVSRYRGYVKVKTYLVLLFPVLLSVKSLLKGRKD